MTDKIADDVLHYRDDNDLLWVRAACGHFVHNSNYTEASKETLCPNCSYLQWLGIDILLTHPEQQRVTV
jgi:hypothetical protein